MTNEPVYSPRCDRRALTLALARQMVRARRPALPDLDRAVLGVSVVDFGCGRCDLVHRTLSAPDLRFQRRGVALVVAGDELPVPDEHDRQVPALHHGASARLSGRPRGRLSRTADELGRAGQVVAAGAAADHPLLGDGAFPAGAVRHQRGVVVVQRDGPPRACSIC